MIPVVFGLLFVSVTWVIALVYALPWWIAACCTALVALIGLSTLAVRRYRGARADQQIQRSLASQAAQFEQRVRPDQRAEVRALAVQFEQALHTLRSSKLAHGRGGALYALPWYVIIGPPGAGKSTAIRQSGLKFPMQGSQGSHGSVRGIGGTRNCDWWLTNEAVLLDTAGRYASEDDDRDEWLSFLDMLRRARPRRPLNGLIVAVSIVDVASADERTLGGLSERIRERIDELMARLEVRLPVYLLFTKCDLLPGFVDSFADLRKSERGQVFGFTLPLGEREELAAQVERQWTRLVQVSERRSLLHLADTRGVHARRVVYEFPQQLEALCDNVSAFSALTFVDNVYRDAPLLRGVYLTSGTQEGSPIDRIMGAMAAAFGLPPAADTAPARAESKSYFLADVFRDVMFVDQDLAANNARAERRLHLARLAAALLTVAATALVVLFSGRSYLSNRDAMREVQRDLGSALTHRVGAQPGPIPLAALEPIRARLVELRSWSQHGAPFRYRAGLYQGAALLPPLHSFYTTTLRAELLLPLVEQLERSVAQKLQRKSAPNQVPSVQDHAWLYKKLRAYLLLTQPKQPGEPTLTPALARWLSDELVEAWLTQEGTKASPGERVAMAEHVSAYLELLAADPMLGFPRQGSVVSGARELLSRVSMVKLAVDRLVSELDTEGQELTLEQLVGASGLPLSARGRVRAAFSRRAWEEQVRPLFERLPPELLGDAWVVAQRGPSRAHGAAVRLDADETSHEAQRCALRSEYFGRFIDEWRTFIGTLRVEEPVDHGRAIVVLQDLTRGQPPPLERVVRAVAHNARLGAPVPDDAARANNARQLGVLEQLKQRVEGATAAQRPAGQEPCGGGHYLTELSVRRALEGFFGFGASWEEPPPGVAAPLSAAQIYQEQLSYLRDALQSYQDDPASADVLLARIASARTRVRSLIETQPVGWRPRFDALLWPPVNGSHVSSSAAMAGEKGQQWCTSVALPFARTLHEHYPFSKQGQDAALADLADFYRPASGILWGFYEATLKRDVVQMGGRFERMQGAAGSMYSPELVRFLDRSAYLSSVLFPPRETKPRVDFEVRVRPSPGIAQVLLSVDGQQVDFHNGPERWFHLTWPGEGDKREATMRIKGARIDETLVQQGEWGLFRLLDKGTLSANPGERFFTARFRLHTQNDVTIDIRPARVENPFVGLSGYLAAFRAPGVTAPSAIASSQKGCHP